MRSGTIVVAVLLAFAMSAGTAFSMRHEASVDKGKALFNDPKLGTTGKSCNDCHPNGKDTDKAAGSPKLPKVVNGCITQALKGKALKEKSVEMQSLVLYIKSAAKEAKPAAESAPATTPAPAAPAPAKKPSVGC